MAATPESNCIFHYQNLKPFKPKGNKTSPTPRLKYPDVIPRKNIPVEIKMFTLIKEKKLHFREKK